MGLLGDKYKMLYFRGSISKMKTKLLLAIMLPLLSFLLSCLILFGLPDYSSTKIVNAQASDQTANFHLTLWNSVNSSLSDLLNSGWKIIAQSSHRVATVTTNGVGAIDQRSFVFTLMKGSKYINCIVTNPEVNKGGYSGCRSLN
jgi:hypothetical protein